MIDKVGIKWFDTIDSTNDEALRCSDNAGDLAVFAADFQTNGRGQRGNGWESGKGENLTFTVLLRPVHVPAQRQFAISEIASLSVVKYLQSKGLEAKIKWPNDIYIGDRKVCGILIEHSFSGVNLSVSIVGIGINLNQTIFASNAPNPTSVLLELGRRGAADGNIPSVERLDTRVELERFMTFFCELYGDINREGNGEAFTLLEECYLSSFYRMGQRCRFIETPPKIEPVNAQIGEPACGKGENIIEGEIIGIDENSCLQIRLADGSVHSYAFKEIKYII